MLRWLPILWALSGAVSAAAVDLAWDPVLDSRLTGYELGWGGATGAYSQYQSAADTTGTLDLAEPGPWHIAVRALGESAGVQIQSEWSNEVVWLADLGGPTQPLDPIGLWARHWNMSAQIIQSKATANGSTLTFDSQTTQGNLIVVFAVGYQATASAFPESSVSDDLGNTYTHRVLADRSYSYGRLWTAPITSAGTTTITIANGGIAVAAAEVSGHASAFVDGVGSAANYASSTTISNLPDTAGNDELVLAFFYNRAATTHTPGTGYTQSVFAVNTVSPYRGISLQYKLAEIAGNHDPSCTYNASSDFAAGAISIIGSVGGVAALPRRALDGPLFGALRGSVR